MSRSLTSVLIIALGALLLPASPVRAGSYPRGGGFKELPNQKDKWYYVDYENWYIKAPDKWQHFMGSLALAEVAEQVTGNKAWAGVISLGLGMLKEFDDAYREGWSKRDLYMDVGGVVSSLWLPPEWKLLAYYNDRQVMLKLSLTVY